MLPPEWKGRESAREYDTSSGNTGCMQSWRPVAQRVPRLLQGKAISNGRVQSTEFIHCDVVHCALYRILIALE
jgi:hypothetical protein